MKGVRKNEENIDWTHHHALYNIEIECINKTNSAPPPRATNIRCKQRVHLQYEITYMDTPSPLPLISPHVEKEIYLKRW
jgi:hypothetical protein